MKFKVNSKAGSKDRLYILEMWIDGRELPVYKIGKASGYSSKKRMLEIVGSYFDRYRETCIVKIKRDRESDNAFRKETELHHYFADRRYVPKHKFSGHTEIFDVTLEEVTEKYEETVEGVVNEKNVQPKQEEPSECGSDESPEAG